MSGPENPGRLGGRFALGRELGSGGMATVYLGRDEVLDRPVAVKVLKPEFVGSDIAARFRREGRTAARLSHPNIVQVYDAGEDELDGRETSYIVMEYVSGGELKGLLSAEERLPEKTLAKVGSDLAAGLAHAHERGIIHRDIKPRNVLLDEHGQAKLTDFGIARALGSSQETQTGVYLGTALYSSPEQLRGSRVTPKSDVYSLGATLYEAATSSPPFTGTPAEIAGQQLSGPPERPRSRGASISPAFESRIMACLEKEPDRRPETSALRVALLQSRAPESGGVGNAGGMAAVGGAGMVRAGRTLAERSAGVAERLKNRRRSGTRAGRMPAGGITLPTRTFGGGRNRAALLAVAAMTILVLLVGALAVTSGSRSGVESGGQVNGQGGVPGAATGDTQREQRSAPRDTAGQTPAPTNGSGARLTEVAAAETVAEMYLDLVRERYAASYARLSQGYRQSRYPTLGDWIREHEDFGAMRFTKPPQAKVSEGEATVKGEMEILKTDGTAERQKGEWTLVEEGGRWKISGAKTPGLAPGASGDEEAGEEVKPEGGEEDE